MFFPEFDDQNKGQHEHQALAILPKYLFSLYNRMKEIIRIVMIMAEENNKYTKHLFSIIENSEGTLSINGWIKLGADVNGRNSEDKTPLMMAVIAGDYKIAEFLVEKGARVDEKYSDSSALIDLVSNVTNDREYSQMVELLIKAGADVNIKTEFGYTPLLIAARNGHIYITEALLKAGADVNAVSPTGKTAKQIARERFLHGTVMLIESYKG